MFSPSVHPLRTGLLVSTLLALVAAGRVDATGTGQFVPHPTVPVIAGFKSSAVALGDLDGDGDADLVVANWSEADTVWLNDGTGAFTPHPTTPAFGPADNSFDVDLGDLDGDGDLDAVVVHALGGQTVWCNDGAGNFTPHPSVPSFGPGLSRSIALGDLDGDEDLDAVVGRFTASETVWLNDGAGAFTAHPDVPSFGAGATQDVKLGDLDDDGDLDAVVVNAFSEAETVWLNNGAGVFGAHPTIPGFGAGNSYEVALGDLDGDGDLDAVVANNNNEAETVWLNDGSGAFGAHPTVPAFGTSWSEAVVLGDLDNDGDLDAVVGNDVFSPPETVWVNDGTGALAPHATPSFGAGYTAGMAMSDLDGDGDPDLVLANFTDNQDSVWLNTNAPPLDSDGDSVADADDNCPANSNADQSDNDADEQGDVCDPDDDNDGHPDADETAAGSDPLNAASTPEVCDGEDNDLDGFTDEGCDQDGDGFEDGFDACPTVPGAFGGCPASVESLVNAVNATTLNHGNKNALLAHLRAAAAALARGHTQAARGSLGAVVNQVEAFKLAGKLPGPVADGLLAQAQALLGAL